MDGRGCLVLVAINDAFSLSLVPFALGRGGGAFLNCWKHSKRSRKAEAGKRSGVEAVTEGKFCVSRESSEVFSARGVSSKDGVGSTESIASVVVGRGGVEMASPARCSQVQYN